MEAAPPPAEHFARYNTEHPYFDLHWTVERGDDRVVVEGIVTTSRISRILEVTVELVALDDGGRVVSRALGTTYGGAMSRGESRPFLIRLRPTGRETRFEVRVWHFSYEHGNNGNGVGR